MQSGLPKKARDPSATLLSCTFSLLRRNLDFRTAGKSYRAVRPRVHRALMTASTPVVDLTADDDAGQHFERAVRKPPMVDTMVKAAGNEDAPVVPGTSEGTRSEGQQDNMRFRIMEFARSVNSSEGLGPYSSLTLLPNQPSDTRHELSKPSRNAWLKELHESRVQRQEAAKRRKMIGSSEFSGRPSGSRAEPPNTIVSASSLPAAATTEASLGKSNEATTAPPAFALLTYNVWFNEEAALDVRLEGISSIIEQEGPDFICLQEMTPRIYSKAAAMAWWQQYHASPPAAAAYFTSLLVKRGGSVQLPAGAPEFVEQPFPNSMMGRSVLCTVVRVGGHPLLVATSHLESPCGRDQLYVQPRQEQLKQGLRMLGTGSGPVRNAVWAGDMNWEDQRDGAMLLEASDTGGCWVDCWPAVRPGNPGYTFDGTTNAMVPSRFKSRLDRVLAKLEEWTPCEARILGDSQLPGQFAVIRRGFGKPQRRPVFPSDHYGLIVKFQANS